jgi:hypothetical protein
MKKITFKPQICSKWIPTAYSQFYIVDPDVEFDTSDNFWIDEAFQRHLAVNNGVIGVDLAHYGSASCIFQLSETPPNLPIEPWDHIVEASLHVSKNNIHVLNCPDCNKYLSWKVPSGDYRVRVYTALSNLSKKEQKICEIQFNPDTGPEFYWIVIWPKPFSPPSIIKDTKK